VPSVKYTCLVAGIIPVVLLLEKIDGARLGFATVSRLNAYVRLEGEHGKHTKMAEGQVGTIPGGRFVANLRGFVRLFERSMSFLR